MTEPEQSQCTLSKIALLYFALIEQLMDKEHVAFLGFLKV